MSKTSVIDLPIVHGAREDIDPKMLPNGAVASVQNMRMRKDGRWGQRNGYTALSQVGQTGRNLSIFDLVSSDDRLVALGTTNPDVSAPSNLYEQLPQTGFEWVEPGDAPDAQFLNFTQGVRDMGSLPSQSTSVTRMDVAAANGLVCMVFEGDGVTNVHLFDASTDGTVLARQITGIKPRVVAVGNVFFITAQNSVSVLLYRFDPASDAVPTAITNAFGPGSVVVHYDMVRRLSGTGFWVALVVDGSTTVREFDSDGEQVQSFSGPSGSSSSVSMVETTSRLHVTRTNTTATVEAFTLAGVSSAGPTALFGGATPAGQIALANVNSDDFMAMAEVDGEDRLLAHPLVVDSHVGLATLNRWDNALLGSKPQYVASVQSTAFAGCYVEIQTDCAPASALASRTNFLAALEPEMVQATKDILIGREIDKTHLPTLCMDAVTGKSYWPNLVVDSDRLAAPLVSEVTMGSTERRQSATLGGLLYLSGGAGQQSDNRVVVESGFSERPRIKAAAASSGGALEENSVYLVAATWEWTDGKRLLHQSPVSDVTTVETGAGEGTLTFTVSQAHTMRDNVTSAVMAGKATLVVYCTEAGRTILKRSRNAVFSSTFGGDVAVTIDDSDESRAEEDVIYTQAGRGVLGNVLEFMSPRPYRYIWRFGKRFITGGLPDPTQFQISREQFPGEPAGWSESLGFFGFIPERITGVAVLDQTAYIFSREGIWTIPAIGPDDTGADDIPAPVRLPSSTGLRDWRSLVLIPAGLVFQGDDDKLWLLNRGGGSPVSFSDAVEDTLAAYPEIVGAFVTRVEQQVTFVCSNSAGTDSRVVSFDLRSNVWSVDDFQTPTPASVAVAHEGRIVRVQSGIAYAEDTAPGLTSFEPHGITTGTLRPFKDAGWGRLIWKLWLVEFRGDCTATGQVSYDDGKTWRTEGQFALSDESFDVGDTVRLQFWPKRRKGDRFRLRLLVTALDGANSEGLVINELSVGVIGERGGPRFHRKRA